jgi:glutathione S-transferase
VGAAATLAVHIASKSARRFLYNAARMEAAHAQSSDTPEPFLEKHDWLSLQDAISTAGVRLVLARFGVPSPWSEFCRALFDTKRIEYRRVDGRDPEGSYNALRGLSGQDRVPVVLVSADAPRSSWLEQLYAAEHLAPATPLLPPDPASRALVIGLIAELCGEGGFGWNRRLQMIARLNAPGAPAGDQQMGLYLKFKYGATDGRDPQSRCDEIVAVFSERMRHQLSYGKGYLFGERLTALDLAWAAFAALIQPLPEKDCPMSARWRELFRWTPQSVSANDVQMLLAHRDRIYRQHLTLPVPTR